MTEAVRPPSTRRPNTGGVVDDIRPGSIAEAAGLRVGDRITAVNGRALRDAVDFRFHIAEPLVELDVLREDAARRVTIEKHPDADLGVGFQDAAFDGVRTCNNACFFCFLKGNPRGMRRTLYVKDDDYRLSFYHGNFVTLTNLTEDDWARLQEQRLSPLNVSVHATDPALRRYLLGNVDAPEIVPQLRRLAAMGLRAHTQVVLCPGVNDGAALSRTIEDLAALYPAIQTISVVPVGATTTAEERIARGVHASEVEGVEPAYARAVIAQVMPYQRRFRREHGVSLVYLADEFYLSAGRRVPAARHYDGFAQYENGIGMVRTLLEDWRAERRTLAIPATGRVRRMSFVCGTLIAPVLRGIAGEFADLTGISVDVHGIENRFFGPRVNVSGLLTSTDIEGQLRGRDLGDVCVLPRYTLDYPGERFLDDRTPDDLQRALAVPVAFASTLREVSALVRDRVESAVTGAAPNAKSNGKAWVEYARAAATGGRGLAKEVR